MSAERQLPDGWRWVTFGEVAREVSKATRAPLDDGFERYVGLEHFDPDSLALKRWGLIAEDNPTFTKVFRAGQLLFGRRRAYQRKAAIADFDGICSGDIIVMEAKPEHLLPDLLPFIVQSEGFWNYAIHTSAGSLSPRTKWANLATYEFPLLPLDEQRRFAEILWAVEKCVERLEIVIGELISLKRIAFGNVIAEYDSVSNQVLLKDLFVRSPESGFSAVEEDHETGCFVLALQSLSYDGYRPGNVKPVALTSQVETARLQRGDFLISRSNTVELVGLPGIFDEERDDISFPDTMMRLHLDVERIYPRYLELYLLSARGRSQIQRRAAGTSHSMKKINRRSLARIVVPLPSFGIQFAICQQIDTFNEKIQYVKASIDAVLKLKSTLLRKLVTLTEVRNVQ
jgi:type I restriction enzyme S subunit